MVLIEKVEGTNERYEYFVVAASKPTDIERQLSHALRPLAWMKDVPVFETLFEEIGRSQWDEIDARAFDKRFLDALQSELATNNEDYRFHRPEIDRAAQEARGGN